MQRPRPREKVSVLMKATRHDPIARIERLLDSISVMNIDINIKHARVRAQELEDAEYDVVDVTETGGFAFLGVVQAPGPVYGDVGGVGGYL